MNLMKTFLIALLFLETANAAYLVKQRVFQTQLGEEIRVESVQKTSYKTQKRKS